MRREGLVKLLDEHMRGADNSHVLVQALNIELWMRLFVDRDRPTVLDSFSRPRGYEGGGT